MPIYVIIPIQLISSYLFAFCYDKLLKSTKIK